MIALPGALRDGELTLAVISADDCWRSELFRRGDPEQA